jgi:hypothetical protein
MTLPTISLIEVNVEEHEEAVLKGAQGIIGHDHPKLTIEIEERHNEGAIAACIRPSGSAWLPVLHSRWNSALTDKGGRGRRAAASTVWGSISQ